MDYMVIRDTLSMLREVSGERTVLLVATRPESRAFGSALGATSDITVEMVETTTAAESLLSEQAVDADCLVTDHDPPAVDARAGIEVATAAAVPCLVVGTDRYTDIGFDPFEAGASEYHQLRGEDGETSLASRRIDQLVETHRESREHEILADAVFEAPDIAVAVLDTDGRLVDVNNRALQFAGLFDEETVLGKPFWETPWCTRTSVSATEYETAIERALSGEHHRFEFTARDRHYNLIQVACSLHPIEADGEVIGSLVLGDDITEKRSTGRRIRVLSRVLRHNLRNNLVAINGHAEFVQEQANEDSQEHAAAIQRVTDDLIEKCELARHVQQALSVDRHPIPTVDITTVLETELDHLGDRYPGVEIEREFPETLPVQAEHGIDIAFRALLDNALEHNDATAPRITVCAERIAPADSAPGTELPEDAVAVTIADNGPGMPEHELRVLEEGSETELEHSSGLGLWASNWVIADSGGRLDFEMTESGGTEVIITLPAAPDEA